MLGLPWLLAWRDKLSNIHAPISLTTHSHERSDKHLSFAAHLKRKSRILTKKGLSKQQPGILSRSGKNGGKWPKGHVGFTFPANSSSEWGLNSRSRCWICLSIHYARTYRNHMINKLWILIITRLYQILSDEQHYNPERRKWISDCSQYILAAKISQLELRKWSGNRASHKLQI